MLSVLKKKVHPVIGYTALALLVGTVAAGGVGVAHGDFDFQGLYTQVQQQDTVLKNHEARLSNVEHDVSDLQQNTKTPPSTEKVEVPVATTPVPATAPTTKQAEKTAVSTDVICDAHALVFITHYSDGSTNRKQYIPSNPVRSDYAACAQRTPDPKDTVVVTQ